MLDACGPSQVYKDTSKTQAGLMCWLEKLQRIHCGKEGKRMVLQWAGSTVRGWLSTMFNQRLKLELGN